MTSAYATKTCCSMKPNKFILQALVLLPDAPVKPRATPGDDEAPTAMLLVWLFLMLWSVAMNLASSGQGLSTTDHTLDRSPKVPCSPKKTYSE